MLSKKNKPVLPNAAGWWQLGSRRRSLSYCWASKQPRSTVSGLVVVVARPLARGLTDRPAAPSPVVAVSEVEVVFVELQAKSELGVGLSRIASRSSGLHRSTACTCAGGARHGLRATSTGRAAQKRTASRGTRRRHHSIHGGLVRGRRLRQCFPDTMRAT